MQSKQGKSLGTVNTENFGKYHGTCEQEEAVSL